MIYMCMEQEYEQEVVTLQKTQKVGSFFPCLLASLLPPALASCLREGGRQENLLLPGLDPAHRG